MFVDLYPLYVGQIIVPALDTVHRYIYQRLTSHGLPIIKIIR